MQPSTAAVESAASSETSLGPNGNVIALIAYLLSPLSGLLVYVLAQDDDFARYHGAQSSVFGLSVIGLYVSLMVVMLVVGAVAGAITGRRRRPRDAPVGRHPHRLARALAGRVPRLAVPRGQILPGGGSSTAVRFVDRRKTPALGLRSQR